jgi:hypothetical protein
MVSYYICCIVESWSPLSSAAGDLPRLSECWVIDSCLAVLVHELGSAFRVGVRVRIGLAQHS